MLLKVPEHFTIAPVFRQFAGDEDIQNGVRALQGFLYQLYDYIIADADIYDKPSKYAEQITDGSVNLSAEFPFLKDLTDILTSIGVLGCLNKNNDAIMIGWNELRNAVKRLSGKKIVGCLRHLENCGLEFSGVDLTEETADFSNADVLEVSYPDNPNMLIGLKIMAMAPLEYSEKYSKSSTGAAYNSQNTDMAFLRCDYRVLGEKEIEPLSVLEEVLKPLSPDIQAYALDLHERYIRKGAKYKMLISSGRTYFRYTYKGKELFHIKVSPKDGCSIIVRAKNIRKYESDAEKFPPFLLDIIKNANECARQETLDKCQPKCSGIVFVLNGNHYWKCTAGNFNIPLTHLTENESRVIICWIDMELSNI